MKTKSKRREGGQSVVEFALVLPILMILLLLTVDVGRLFYAYVGVVNASREGTAYAITNVATAGANDPKITTYAQQEGSSNYTVTAACAPSCAPGGTVKVSVNTTFGFLFPVLLPNLQLGSASTGLIQ